MILFVAWAVQCNRPTTISDLTFFSNNMIQSTQYWLQHVSSLRYSTDVIEQHYVFLHYVFLH